MLTLYMTEKQRGLVIIIISEMITLLMMMMMMMMVPIVVTLVGIVIDVSDVHPAKAFEPKIYDQG